MKQKRIMLFSLTIIAITFLACNNPRMSNKERILLSTIKELDSIQGFKSTPFCFAITHWNFHDTTTYWIKEIDVITAIKYDSLSFLFLDYRMPVFSDFKFIKTANSHDFEMTLKQCFPGQYIPGWEAGPPPEVLDGYLPNFLLKFHDDSLVFKGSNRDDWINTQN